MLKRGRNLFGNIFKSDADKVEPLTAETYSKLIPAKDRQFARKKPTGEFIELGDVQSHEAIAGGARFHSTNGTLQVRFITSKMLEIRLRPDGNFPPPFSYSIDPAFEIQEIATTLSEDSQTIRLKSASFTCEILKQGTQLSANMGDEVEVGLGSRFTWREDDIVVWNRPLPTAETCHGMGQRAAGLDLRGQEWKLWNYDPVGYHRGDDPCYYSIPFYFGLHPEYAIGVLWDNPAKGLVDLGKTKAESMYFSAEGGELRLYIMLDKNPEIVLQEYMSLTGKAPLVPLWVFGFHQSRWGYPNSDRFRELASEFRKRKIPCDTLHFDIDYMDGYRLFTYSPTHFADLPQLVSELRDQGFKSVAILDPAIKTDPANATYQEGVAKGYFFQYPDGEEYRAVVWAGESAFPDFTNAAVREWWAGYVRNLVKDVGFAGLWNDMNEPVIFTVGDVPSTVPEYLTANWDGEGTTTQREAAHNIYGTQMARATRMGLEAARPDKRPYTLTRAAYAGAQRYTTSWTGDNHSTWDHLKLSISMLLNLGLSGMPFTGPDTGGFFDTPTPEMVARWVQLSSMLPFFRMHTIMDSPPQEPWSFGTETEGIVREAINLRYRLLPYLYSSFVQSVNNGLPMIRPLFLADRKDTKLYNLDDAFMVGDSLLVAPVLEEGQTKREVYLPRGLWYNYWTRKMTDGAKMITVDAPLNQLPLFVKAGATIPHWPVQQFIGEKPLDELHLMAYAGNAETTLYEDEGEGFGYRDGDYRLSYIGCRHLPNSQFGVDWRTAGAYKSPYQKVRLEVIGIIEEPESVIIDDQPAALWFYENGVVEVLNAPFQSVRIVGRTPDDATSAETVIRRPPGLDFN